jgi:hypothetical protein
VGLVDLCTLNQPVAEFAQLLLCASVTTGLAVRDVMEQAVYQSGQLGGNAEGLQMACIDLVAQIVSRLVPNAPEPYLSDSVDMSQAPQMTVKRRPIGVLSKEQWSSERRNERVGHPNYLKSFTTNPLDSFWPNQSFVEGKLISTRRQMTCAS